MPEAANRSQESLTSIARRWGVSKMVLSKWKRRGYPVYDDKALAGKLLLSNTPERIKHKALNFSYGFTGKE